MISIILCVTPKTIQTLGEVLSISGKAEDFCCDQRDEKQRLICIVSGCIEHYVVQVNC